MSVTYLNGLNDRQKEAVLHTDGPLLIVAGAGAGKTKTITSRIAHLIHEGVHPSQILAVTFTNKAGKEMKDRIRTMLAGVSGMPFVSTFHGLGVSILREHGEKIGIKRQFVILDESDAVNLVKQSIIFLGLDPKQHEPKKYKSIISKMKGDGKTVAEMKKDISSYTGEMVARIWQRYEELAAKEHGLDFDDLLTKSVTLLRLPDVRQSYHNRFTHVHIDEYQDTNGLQYEMVRLLVGPANNVCVVGDSDQTIYSWRGANIKNILSFETDYPGAKKVLLEENYRSTSTILAAANAVIDKNELRQEKTLFTKNSSGHLITLAECYDESAEADYVAGEVHKLLLAGADPEKIAILYRANFQSRTFEDALLMAQIPYQVLGTKFFERKEVKDVLCYIRAALNPVSFSDIKRIINVPTRGLGKTTVDKLFAAHVAGTKAELPAPTERKVEQFYALLRDIKTYAETHQPSELVRYVILHSGLEKALKDGSEEDRERLENIKELATLATKYDDDSGLGEKSPLLGVEKLLEDAALATDQDTLLKDTKGIRLMTVHASKGLEFKTVFIVGLEHDLFPHGRGNSAGREEKEEERRLFYVAITRAEEKLYLTHATVRTIFGSRQIQAPSEYLYDIPEELLERTSFGSRYGTTRVIHLD